MVLHREHKTLSAVSLGIVRQIRYKGMLFESSRPFPKDGAFCFAITAVFVKFLPPYVYIYIYFLSTLIKSSFATVISLLTVNVVKIMHPCKMELSLK